jgi:anti-sigma regulatory factor (Ser/Thr protein kinase)
LACEIVTNAVTHGTEGLASADLPPVRLRLSSRTRGVQIEVWDGSDEMPRLRSDAAGEEPGGRGLLLVDAIASR